MGGVEPSDIGYCELQRDVSGRANQFLFILREGPAAEFWGGLVCGECHRGSGLWGFQKPQRSLVSLLPLPHFLFSPSLFLLPLSFPLLSLPPLFSPYLPISPLSACNFWIIYELSVTAPAPCQPVCCHGSHHDHELTIWNLHCPQPVPIKCFHL